MAAVSPVGEVRADPAGSTPTIAIPGIQGSRLGLPGDPPVTGVSVHPAVASEMRRFAHQWTGGRVRFAIRPNSLASIAGTIVRSSGGISFV